MNKPSFLFAAVMVLTVVAAFITIGRLPGGELVIKNAETGAEYARFPLSNGELFSVTFIHSVDRSPFTDYYSADSGGIYLAGARYYSFGSGTEAAMGQELEFCADGSLRVSGIKNRISRLVYLLGADSDYTLGINGVKYSLIHLCGKNKILEFVFEY